MYLFRDGKGRVIYVGKAKSVRKRVASHFSKAQVPESVPGHAEMVASVEHIECVVVATEAEALLAEQSFIKQYRPRFNIRLRDDKSYPFIAISLDEDYPRVYFTRERHRPGRAYFGPYSNAKRVRGTLEVLAKVFMFRSCTGPEPGRRSGSPCLDYYIKRCEAPCVGYVSKEDYRKSIDGVIDFLSGRFKAIERDLEARMRAAAAAEEFEQATLERNRLRAVRSLLERRRVANESVGTLDAVAVAVDGREANAQVFQVRDGVLSDRQSFYLSNETERDVAEVAEEFMLQYYAGHMSIPALLVVQRELAERAGARRGSRQPARRAGGAARGRARREAPDPRAGRAQRAPGARPGAPARRAPPPEPRGGARGPAAGARPRRAADPDRVLRHLQPRRHAHGRLDGRVRGRRAEEVRLPPLHDPHAARAASDDYASMAEVLGRRFAQWERQADISPHDPAYDASFAALPNVVVIDGGKGQLAAGLAPLRGFRERGVAVVSLAKRIEELFLPGRAAPLVLDHSHARAAAAAARARRGASLRDHPPPHAPRQGDDELAARRAARRRPGAQARAARALRLARGGRGGLARGAAGGARPAGEGRAGAARPPAPRRLSRPRVSTLVDTIVLQTGHNGRRWP